MPAPRRTSPPLWFRLAVAAALALALRLINDLYAPGQAAPSADAPLQLAFWGWIATIASWIWTGVQVAARVSLAILEWSVKVLWAFAQSVHNGLVALGRGVTRGFQLAWGFLRSTYESVLLPAWQKFWQWFERFRGWLEDVLRPVFRFLEMLRAELLGFYNKWIRPILDSIDIARKVLRVFATLGADWARAADRRLAELQEWIAVPFRIVLAKLNEAIDTLDRIVDAGGLFQRLTLMRSIERDIAYVARSFWRSQVKGLTPEEAEEAASQEYPELEREEFRNEYAEWYVRDAGPLASRIGEHVAIWRDAAGLKPR